MRLRFFILIMSMLTAFSVKSQYFFKDILLTRNNQDNWKSYHDQRVRDVSIQSIDANNEPSPGFICSQAVASDFSSIATFTKSADIPASTLTTYYDRNGRILQTVDTSESYKSTTDYGYNEKGEIISLLNTSLETDNHLVTTEKHLWIYDGTGPVSMVKIKGDSDTTYVSFIKDEKGNITEEKPVRAHQPLPTVYYYYDTVSRLTDIVRYNQKAGRLLPDFVFEYNAGHLSSMLSVPPGSNDYQRWIYVYDAKGLKSNETCYDKKRQVIVKIRYSYTFH